MKLFKKIAIALIAQTILTSASNNDGANAALLKACMSEREIDNVDDVMYALKQV